MFSFLKESKGKSSGDDGSHLSRIFNVATDRQAMGFEYDTKTIYGSELVKFAVHQTNDILRLEDLLVETNHLFICKNTSMDDNKKLYEFCVRNQLNDVLFHIRRSKEWTSSLAMMLKCTRAEFGYRIFNEKNREIMVVSGSQCCFCNGQVDLMCGNYHLGGIRQADSKSYKILDPDGSECFTLRKQSKGQYDVLHGKRAQNKVGEVRQSWAELPLLEDIHIFYGVTLHPDLPLHEKYLIFGSSFLLFYQKYRNWNNQRKFQYICFGQTLLLIVILSVVAAFVMWYK